MRIASYAAFTFAPYHSLSVASMGDPMIVHPRVPLFLNSISIPAYIVSAPATRAHPAR